MIRCTWQLFWRDMCCTITSAPQTPQPPPQPQPRSQPQPPQAQPGVCCVVVTKWSSPVVDVSFHGDHERGAAWRRRQRRPQMHWRHEQLTLQMALTAASHHSRDVRPVSFFAPRSLKTARAGEGGERRVDERQGLEDFSFHGRSCVLFEWRAKMDLSMGGGHPVWASRQGCWTSSSKHCGACRRDVCARADSRCPGAADGGPVGGRLQDHRKGGSC